MKERLKNMAAIILVVLLLPYVIAIIWNGDASRNTSVSAAENRFITVKFEGGDEKIDMEQYIIGVLPTQIPITYHKEALKAQALIIRTQILKAMGENTIISEEDAGMHYMTIDDMEKAWGTGNYEDNYSYISDAVKETAGEAVYYNNELIEPSFHAVSAGKTRNVSDLVSENNTTYPYFESVDSSWDLKSENYLQSVQIEKAKVIENLKKKNNDLQVTEDTLMNSFEILTQDSAGYVNSIRIGNITMSGEDFRNCLSLNSAAFSIDEFEGKVRIITKGLGHGIGLSQYGADCMALEGKNYKDILKYYYKDIEIKQYYE